MDREHKQQKYLKTLLTDWSKYFTPLNKGKVNCRRNNKDNEVNNKKKKKERQEEKGIDGLQIGP
jgi:hypothetical protein